MEKGKNATKHYCINKLPSTIRALKSNAKIISFSSLLTSCPRKDHHYVKAFLVARQVRRYQRGKPPVAASPDANENKIVQKRVTHSTSHLPAQLKYGAALELEGGPGVFRIDVPAVVSSSEANEALKRLRIGSWP